MRSVLTEGQMVRGDGSLRQGLVFAVPIGRFAGGCPADQADPDVRDGCREPDGWFCRRDPTPLVAQGRERLFWP